MSTFAHVSMSMSPWFHVSIHQAHVVSMFPEFRKRQTELTENDNFQGFSENGMAIFCLFAAEQKQKTNICFHSSTNDKL
jgi:hypothetical protein